MSTQNGKRVDNMKRMWINTLVCLLACALLGGCAAGGNGEQREGTASGEDALAVTQVGVYQVEYKPSDTDATVESSAKHITLNGDSIAFDGTASLATVSGSSITIKAGGTYVVSGRLDNGQILINELGNETVRLVLDGADITCQTSAPIYVMEAKKVVLILADGSENTVTDGSDYVLADEAAGEPNAAVFSKGDLSITGGGTLTVNANYNNGINCKDSLKITGGTINVIAVGNGIKGKDCVAIADGTITVNAGHDGIKSTNTAEVEAGFVRLDGGTITVEAAQDGLQAETGMVIGGGTVTVKSGGGSTNASSQTGGNWGQWGGFFGGGQTAASDGDTTSAKGLKAALALAVSGGTVTVDSSDDALHCNGSLTVSGGTLNLASGDDGVHADSTLSISGGDLTVTKSYEGLEALTIAISGGNTHVTASDDGINAGGGNDGSSVNGRPGQNPFAATEDAKVEISGGYVVLSAAGDGLDSNNTITMSGGTVLVWGPTDGGNGAIDYAGSFTMNGGTLVAAGSSGMAESITGGDARALFLACASQAAGTPVRIEDKNGDEVITLAPPKAFSSAVIVTPQLIDGESYTVYVGGETDGSVTDGVVRGGSYTAGELSTTVTLSGVSTMVNLGGSVGMGGPGGMGGGRPDGMGGGRPGGRM